MPKSKHPKDNNQSVKIILEIATSEIEHFKSEESQIKAAAATLGRKGGLKGGKARAESLTAERRAEIARKAAQTRWSKNK